MNTTIRNILAVILGLFIGGAVNFGIILLSGHIIPPPAGADVTTEAGLKASMHLFQPKHFIFPFLAHAIGTFVGACICAALATKAKMRFAMIIGLGFLIGGIMEVVALPAPMWYNITDLAGAYIPMSFLAGLLFAKK